MGTWPVLYPWIIEGSAGVGLEMIAQFSFHAMKYTALGMFVLIS